MKHQFDFKHVRILFMIVNKNQINTLYVYLASIQIRELCISPWAHLQLYFLQQQVGRALSGLAPKYKEISFLHKLGNNNNSICALTVL